MKIAILGDTHFGVRSDKPAFHKYFRRFYQECFFPYLWDHNITNVIQTGDLFDRRKFVNYNTLYQSKRYFFNEFGKGKLHLDVYPGNHDIYYKQSLKVNSLQGNLRSYVNSGAVTIYMQPTTVQYDDCAIDLIPWICDENREHVFDFISKTKSSVCIGHFELTGFESDKGHVCASGMDRSILKRYEIAMSGHFHHRSTDGQIFYVGAPCEHTWIDYDDPKGFHIFDTTNRELEFVRNPFSIHQKIKYDDSDLSLQQIEALDFSKQIADCIVKIVVVEKKNPVLFDAYMDRIYAASPLEVTIVENFVQAPNALDINQSDDTMTLIYKTVDTLDLSDGTDREIVKAYLKGIHEEAQAYAD